MFDWLLKRHPSDICVYDWSGYEGSLLENVVPGARRIRAMIGQSPQRVARRLPRSMRLLIVHLDISDDAPFISNAQEFDRVMSERGIKVLNHLLPDIRKRTVQACCQSYGLPSVAAHENGDEDELLIVKTDLNSGGAREQQLSAGQKARFHLPASIGRLNGPSGYFVKRRGDLGADIWRDPDLVVERYMTNPQGRFYRVYCAGNAVVISEAYDEKLVKRMGGDIRRHNHRLWRRTEHLYWDCDGAATLSPALLRTAGVFAHRFQLDYGAIDVVESDAGEFHIVDVNKTPYWGDESQPGLLEHLRQGFSSRPVEDATIPHGMEALSAGFPPAEPRR
jgi:hypothetical protein